MSEKLKKIILKKPWGLEEKERTINIIQRANEKKSKFILVLDKFVYFFVLFTAIAGNFIVSVVLVPFLLIMGGFYLYMTLFFIGLAFGALFNVIINYLEKLESRHHIIAGFFIPVLALINMYIITNLSNHLVTLMQLRTLLHNPVIVSITYIVGFIVPYFWSRHKTLLFKPKAYPSSISEYK